MATALTIASSDSGGGAGIQADLKAFAAAGVFGTSAIVALTAQNTVGVTAIHELPPDFVRAELDAVFDDIGVDAAKTGMLFSRVLIETVADWRDGRGIPRVVDPVMLASAGAQLLEDDAVDALTGRLFPLAAVVTPNLLEALALVGAGTRAELAERLVGLGAGAAIVTGGHGDDAIDHLFDGERHIEIQVERHEIAATHGAGCTHSATLAALLARGEPLEEAARGGPRRRAGARRDRCGRRPGERARMISAGTTLAAIRERKPLVHNITNYVVMNETANATIALGALPVMAHAGEEVEDMARLASALVINIGTLSPHWVDAMLLAGGVARCPIVLDPVGAGATEYRTHTAHRILDAIDVTVLRGNPGEVATLVGAHAEVRGVESIVAGLEPAELARTAAERLGLVASVTGPVDHVSDGKRVLAVANGHPLLAAVTGTGCISSALTGAFLAAKPDEPLEAAAEALAAYGVAAEDAAAGADGPGTFHARLYDALYALDPATLDERTRIEAL